MDLGLGPIELPDQGDNIIRTYDCDFKPNPKGLGNELFWSMKKHRDHIAQVEAATDESDTYGSLLNKCVRTAVELQARGIAITDIISPCTTNHINTCVPFVAALFLGVKVAPLDPSLSVSDMKHLLNLIKPKLIFASPDALDKLEESIREISLKTDVVVFGEIEGYASFDDFLKPSDQERCFEPVEVKDIFETGLIYFTSGSTGLAKGICMNHFSLLSQMNRNMFGSSSQTAKLLYSPLFWFSAAYTIIYSAITGDRIIVSRDFTPSKTWHYFEKYKPTSVILTPTEAMHMLKYGRPDNIDTSSLKALLVGGSNVSPENLTSLRNMFPGTVILYGYGLTEVAGGALRFPMSTEGIATMVKKPNSVGKPMIGFWYKVVDPESEQILGPNQRGELRLKSKYLMNGYYAMDSSSAWDSDGWLRTGDVCYYDEDHCFFMVDRLKDIIKYRGWQISPAYIEGVLNEHPAVKTAVVVGVPHEEDGEHAFGLVELSEDAGDISSDELIKFASDRVKDDRKKLHGLKFVTDIPYTPSGKIKKNLLKSNILAELS